MSLRYFHFLFPNSDCRSHSVWLPVTPLLSSSPGTLCFEQQVLPNPVIAISGEEIKAMQQFWGQNICFPTQSLSRDSPPINCFFHLAFQPEICSSEPSSPARFQLCPSDDNKPFFFFKIKKKAGSGRACRSSWLSRWDGAIGSARVCGHNPGASPPCTDSLCLPGSNCNPLD